MAYTMSVRLARLRGKITMRGDSVKITGLVKTIDQMSDAELMERIREIRHNRETVRPAAAKHVERAETKTSRKKVSSVEKLLEGLSDAERASLLAQLELNLEPKGE